MSLRTDNSAVVEIRDVVKIYGDTRAVDGVTLSIPPGICYALLGPNGAGKSTLSRMIGGMSHSDSGMLRVLNLDPWQQQSEVKARTGVVLQDDALDEDLDVLGNLQIYGMFFWKRGPALEQKIRELLAFMELNGRERTPIHELSGGMRRRLMIARALLNDPAFLILDEPTTGLDPQVRHTIWSALRKLKNQGMSLLLTTHYMEEAAQLADAVGILNKGKLIAQDSPDGLIGAHLPRSVLEFDAITAGQGAAADKLKSIEAQSRAERHGDRAFIFDNDEQKLLRWKRELDIRDAQVRASTLEDVFLKLTGRSLNE